MVKREVGALIDSNITIGFLPPSLTEEFQKEVLDHYRQAAEKDIPDLWEDLCAWLRYYYVSSCHYQSTGDDRRIEDIFDPDGNSDGEWYSDLIAEYEDYHYGSFQDEFREEIENILNRHHLFYKVYYLESVFAPGDVSVEYLNNPLSPVW